MSLQRRTKPVMSTWTKERTIDFIEKYRERELLWRVGCKDYLSKTKREQAYEELLAFVKTFVSDANRDTIIAKINNLRSTWRREYKKVTYSQSEDGFDEKYEPTLFYYDHMRFILNSELYGTQSDTDNNTETQDAESQDGDQSTLRTHTTADDHNDDFLSDRSFSPVDVKVDLDNDEPAPTLIPEPVPTTLTTTTPPPAPDAVLTLTTAPQPTPKHIPTPAPEPVPTLSTAPQPTPKLISTRVPEPVPTLTTALQPTPKLISTRVPERVSMPVPAAAVAAALEARKRNGMEHYDVRKKKRKIYHHQEEEEEEEEAGEFRSPRASTQNPNPSPKLNCSDVVHRVVVDTAKEELDCFGKMMTHALLGMPRDQMIHAKKMISEVIYEGQLNNLSRASAFLPNPSTDRNKGAGPLYAYLTSDDSGQYSTSTSDI